MKRPIRAISLAIVVAILTSSTMLIAQIDPSLATGSEPFKTFEVGDIDSVNLFNGTLTVRIPLMAYPQRGGFLTLNFSQIGRAVTYINKQCDSHGQNCRYFWRNSLPGFSLTDDQNIFGSYGLSADGSHCYYAVYSADGAAHPVADFGNLSAETIDGTGFYLQKTSPTCGVSVVIDKNGTRYSTSGSNPITTKREDANGNIVQYVFQGLTGTYTDTNGRTIPGTPIATDTTGCLGQLPIYSASEWDVPGPSASQGVSKFKFCYAKVPVNIPGGNGIDQANATQWVNNTLALQSILLPNGKSWIFEYNDRNPGDPQTVNYGLVTRITYPTGATITYTYATNDWVSPYWSRWVTSRTVNANDGQGDRQWTYTATAYINNGSYAGLTNTVADPAGNSTVHSATFLNGYSCLYETLTQYNLGSATLVKSVTTDYVFQSGNGGNPTFTDGCYGVVPIRKTTTWANSTVYKVETDYDAGLDVSLNTPLGLVVAKREYNFGGSSVLRSTTYKYLYQSNASYVTSGTNRINILDRFSQIAVFSGSASSGVCGSISAASCTTYGYDESPLQSSGVSQALHDTNPVNGSLRGNQTSVNTQLINGSATSQAPCSVSVSNGGFVVSTKAYFDTGTVQTSKDPCTYATVNQYSLTYAGAYLTTSTNPLSQGTNYAYDANTGQLTSLTDSNSQPTTAAYDPMLRIAQLSYPDGGQTLYCYTDIGGTCSLSGPPYSVVATQAIAPSLNKTYTYTVDGLGRLFQTQLSSDPGGPTYTQIVYDSLGRKSQVYNPTRCSPPTANCNLEPTWGYTTYAYDPLDRVTSVVKQDGSIVATDYSAFPCMTVTDEAHKARKSCLDASGRVSQVFEDPGGLKYEMDYQFDVLDNLVLVTQNGSGGTPRVRTFYYDSLSRLTSAANPESGTITYVYDADGNVIKRIGPLPNQNTGTVTTNYSYDKLNRLTAKTYTGMATTSVQYSYDGGTLSGCTTAPPAIIDSYPVGRRSAMCDGSGATSWSHDQMGRVLKEKRILVGSSNITRTVTYGYYLDGSLKSLLYPSSRTITYTEDGGGRPVSAIDSANAINYVTGATYAPIGSLAGLSEGSSINGALSYNSRLQPLQLYYTVGSISSSTLSQLASMPCPTTTATILSRSYNLSPGSDNGNVISITNCIDSNRTQNFQYDSLNRIITAYSTGPAWGNSYVIDPWGNLTNMNAVAGKTLYQNLQAAPASSQNQLYGYGYDGAGNITSDGPTIYTYDAENRLVGAGPSGGGWTYVYDGDGNRVEKCNPCNMASGGTLYWRDGNGDVLVESDLSGTLTNEYVYFDGKRTAKRDSSGNVSYYFEDHLGSTAVVTGSGGAIKDDIDYLPYGAEDKFTYNQTENYQFTGKERDGESGLDNFGARYYRSSLGRFMTPDWATKPTNVPYANFGNPQSLNLYSYVNNNPTTARDPDGHDAATDTLKVLGGIEVACPECTPLVGAGALLVGSYIAYENRDAIVQAFDNLFSKSDGSNNAPPPANSQSQSQSQSTPADPNGKKDDGGTKRTEHGQQRADEARAGDAHRDVGDANRTINEGKQYTDSETGNNVSVRGNRVVITDQEGNEVSQFKNTRANTQQRIDSGKWVPKQKPEGQ